MPGVCRAVAEFLGLSPGDVAQATTENAICFFNLDQKTSPSTGDRMTSGRRPGRRNHSNNDIPDGQQETSVDASVVYIEIVSFGYLRGSGQPEADAIYSARHISNPHGGPKTHLSGLDARLRKEVMRCDGARELFDEVYNEIELRTSRSGAGQHLTIAIGCDYGKHRSVTLCEELAFKLKQSRTAQGHRFRVKVIHREEESWSGKVGQHRWQKAGTRGQRCTRERVVRDAEEIAAENESED